MRRFLIGLAGGFTLGYIAIRAYDALIDLGQPVVPASKDARAYGRARRALMLSSIARSSASLGWVAFALAPAMRRGRARPEGRVERMAWIALAAAGTSLFELPVDYVEDHVLERRYGLSKQSAPAWAVERAKALGVTLAITLPLVELLAAVARHAPRSWPLLGTLGTAPLLVLANLVAPTFIMPLFNTFEPLTGRLEERLRSLASRYGVGDAQILRVDMSRQTEKANAYVVG
jgi:CAAX prenyl protease-like protein